MYSVSCIFIYIYISVDISVFLLIGLTRTLVGVTSSGSNDGVGTNAKFGFPWGVAFNPTGTILYVADTDNNVVRSILITSGIFLFLVYLFIYLLSDFLYRTSDYICW
jgi:DNA-binding beta-propeller fold protein YncE